MNRLAAARWYILAASLWLLAFVATHWPAARFPKIASGWNQWDKGIHFLLFAVLAMIFSVVAAKFGKSAPLLVWPLLASYGLLDEVTQSFVPGRSCDGLDWLADCLGAATGVGLYLLLARLRPSETAQS
ncbi:VanZ family protein [Blastopirellula marina]|uniref:VanZ-like domain-containing protein n=1 Tax=Blastopirellula marina DSM 3645 TaxID=314230 RepID=A3ZYG2_9BACT|nr:VanZ family protein [Blastopirellula marina]EAQ78412.1 hypothetical protein DSM3645_06966 [Blastopirellula marina DSM 3645]